VNFEAWLPIFVLAVVFSAVLLVHLFTHDVPFMPKWAWALLIVLTMPLGGVIYLMVVVAGAGTQREDAEGRTPQA
jgi:ABC-type transport system involved in cytochrome bd biosynthesis fused ATPase/permease subunit